MQNLSLLSAVISHDGSICIIQCSYSQHCSLTLSPTVLLTMCTVSHPLPPHAHPALTVVTVPHSLSMHKKLKCTSPLKPLWCSWQGDHILDTNITVANVTRLTMRGESSFSDNIPTVVRNGPVGFSFTNMVEIQHSFFSFYLLQQVRELW